MVCQDKADEEQRKAELELLVMDEQDDGRGYDLKELVAGEDTKKKTMSKRKLKRSKKKDEEVGGALLAPLSCLAHMAVSGGSPSRQL